MAKQIQVKEKTAREKENRISFEEIRMLLHENAETGFIHTTYQEESKRFHLLMNGDMRAVAESQQIINPEIQGTLSLDPLRNMRYLFIINTALATRYMIEAGIPQETVYSTSDVYIQKADLATNIEQIEKLNTEVWTLFVKIVQEHKKGSLYSGPVYACLNYIDSHFNQKITLDTLSGITGKNPCYLAGLFKKETGKTFSAYLTDLRIRTSKALLKGTDYTYSQIAYSLGFCSQSHFTSAFRKLEGCTPKQFRVRNYNSHLTGLAPLS